MTPLIGNIVLLAAEAGGAAAATGGDAPNLGRSLFSMAPIFVIIIGMFWFMTRSQRKRDRKRREMLDDIRAKDDIVTIGGIHGRVIQVKDDEVVVRIDADRDIKVTIAKTGIARKKGEPEEPQ